jgi:hypothetical protein
VLHSYLQRFTFTVTKRPRNKGLLIKKYTEILVPNSTDWVGVAVML